MQHVLLVKHIFEQIFGEIISLLDGVWESVFRAAGGSVILRNFRKMELCALKIGSYSKGSLK